MVAEVLLDRLDRLHLVPWDHDEEGGVPTYLVEASGPEPVSLAALDVGALAEERHRRILVLVVLRADLLDALLDPPIQRLGDLLDLNEAPHGEGASVCSIWFLIAGRPAIAFILPHRRIEVAPLPPPRVKGPGATGRFTRRHPAFRYGGGAWRRVGREE